MEILIYGLAGLAGVVIGIVICLFVIAHFFQKTMR